MTALVNLDTVDRIENEIEWDEDNYLHNLDSTYGREWNVPKIVTFLGVELQIVETPYLDEDYVFTSVALCNGKSYIVTWDIGTNIFRLPEGTTLQHVIDWANPSQVTSAASLT